MLFTGMLAVTRVATKIVCVQEDESLGDFGDTSSGVER